MSDGFIWASYLATYGLIAGYAVTVWNRIRTRRRRSADPGP
ncbi:MAG TPA: hypothetical protein VLB67_08875 [Acidimicrobiia bacterium]|nr:hypothetical protein [Acidimicrobiia bacterium]